MMDEKNELQETKAALTEKQRQGLELLAEMDLEKFKSASLQKKCSWVGRFFQWIDDNILSKTTRLWMYFLEIAGVIFIFIIIKKVEVGLNLVALGRSTFELQKAEIYINSLTKLAPAIATMVATICGAIPTIMGVFRSLKKKWNAPGTNGAPAATP